jgi:hypothetical protein
MGYSKEMHTSQKLAFPEKPESEVQKLAHHLKHMYNT